jgi:hypothetical protein
MLIIDISCSRNKNKYYLLRRKLQILEKIMIYYRPKSIRIKRTIRKEGIVHKKVVLLIVLIVTIRIDLNKIKNLQIKMIKIVLNHTHTVYKKALTSKMLSNGVIRYLTVK